VITDIGTFVEVQGTAESEPFSAEQYGQLVSLAQVGAKQLVTIQRQALAAAKPA
jgi:ribonuclease PH